MQRQDRQDNSRGGDQGRHANAPTRERLIAHNQRDCESDRDQTERPQALKADQIRAADLAFPGLFPPIAVALPIIFSAAAPGLDNKAIIFGLGMGVLVINWLAMRHSKSMIEAIGPTPLQLLGAVFGVLQTTLGIEFILDAYRML